MHPGEKIRRAREASGRTEGLSMVEIAITISLLGLILVGILGSLSTGFLAQRSNGDLTECQMFTQQVIEEIRSTPFADLLSFNGTYVDDAAGTHRARIAASVYGMNLVKIEVVTSSLSQPQNSCGAVTLMANMN